MGNSFAQTGYLEVDEMFQLIQCTCFAVEILITPEMGKILYNLGY